LTEGAGDTGEAVDEELLRAVRGENDSSGRTEDREGGVEAGRGRSIEAGPGVGGDENDTL
jgi:hypothetical protein